MSTLSALSAVSVVHPTSETPWYVDSATGDDANTGRAPRLALKTHAEMMRRWAICNASRVFPPAAVATATAVSERARREGSTMAWHVAADAWREAGDEATAELCDFVACARRYGFVTGLSWTNGSNVRSMHFNVVMSFRNRGGEMHFLLFVDAPATHVRAVAP